MGSEPVPMGSPWGLPPSALSPQSWGDTHCATRPWQVLTQSQGSCQEGPDPQHNPQGALHAAPPHLPKCLFHAEGRRTVSHQHCLNSDGTLQAPAARCELLTILHLC